MRPIQPLMFVFCLLAAGCAGSPSSPDAAASPDLVQVIPPRRDYDKPGPYPVGDVRTDILDRGGKRRLSVQIWYPADEADRATAQAGHPVEEFETDPARRAQVATWIAAANEPCTRKRATSGASVRAAEQPARFPLLLFSHCTKCVRWSASSVAERLTSHGFAVAAPDHEDDTIFAPSEIISDAFLAVRASDISSVIDALVDDGAAAVPAALRGRFDGTRVGVIGHSYGAATAGKVLELDMRVRAGFFIAAPIDSPLLNRGGIQKITKPTFFLLAEEDNSIGSLGNTFLVENFDAAPPPTWLGSVADAGHWSFSDISGLDGKFLPGCGVGERQTDREPFTYLDNVVGRGVAQGYAAGFFAAHLDGDPGAPGWISLGRPSDKVKVTRR